MPIRERAGKWHYRFYVQGREFAGSTDLDATARNKTAALRREAEVRHLVLEGKQNILKLQIKRFDEAAEQFLDWADGHYSEHPNSADRIRTSFTSLTKFFGRTPLTSITPGDIDDFTAWRRREHGVRDVTIRHDLHALSVCMQYARRHNWARENPVRESEIPSDKDAVRMHVLTPEEEREYFRITLSRFTILRDGNRETHGPFPNLHDLGRLMLNQGCRPEELLALEKQAVDLRERTFRIVRGKSRAAKRRLDMTEESLGILTQRMRDATPWIFPGRSGDHATKLNNAHNAVLAAAGFAFVIYDFRHTFATRMAKAGMPLPVLAAILGHGDLRSVQKYIHIAPEDTRAAMKRYATPAGVSATSSPIIGIKDESGAIDKLQ